jgi:hypothetical protein
MTIQFLEISMAGGKSYFDYSNQPEKPIEAKKALSSHASAILMASDSEESCCVAG